MSLCGEVRKRKIKLCAHIDLSDKDQPEQCFNLFSLLCTISAVAESRPPLFPAWAVCDETRLRGEELIQCPECFFKGHVCTIRIIRFVQICQIRLTVCVI